MVIANTALLSIQHDLSASAGLFAPYRDTTLSIVDGHSSTNMGLKVYNIFYSLIIYVLIKISGIDAVEFNNSRAQWPQELRSDQQTPSWVLDDNNGIISLLEKHYSLPKSFDEKPWGYL